MVELVVIAAAVALTYFGWLPLSPVTSVLVIGLLVGYAVGRQVSWLRWRMRGRLP